MTGYQRTPDEASQTGSAGYSARRADPGQLLNAVFLDVIDADVVRMERLNEMIGQLVTQAERFSGRSTSACSVRR
jgi:hypothetical protein